MVNTSSTGATSLNVNKTLTKVFKGLQRLRAHGDLTDVDYDEVERLADMMERLVAQLKDDGK